MKKRIRHFSKSTLSIVLSLCMLISCVSVGLIATDAAQINAEERVVGGRDWQGNIFFRAPDGWDLTSYPYIQVWAVQSDSANSGKKYAFKLSDMSIVGTTSNSRLYHCNISTKIEHSSWNDEYIAFTANTSNWNTGDFYISTCGQYTKPLAYTACNTNGSYLFSPSDSSNNTATNNNTISGEFNGTGRDVLNKNQDFYVYTNGSSSATGGTLGVAAHYLNGSNYNGSSAIAGNEITVNSDDTNVHETYTAVEGTKVTLTANASTGYKLDGIYDAATGGNEITSPYYVLGTKSVYARFSPQSYTITYKDGGDTAFSGTHASGYPTTHTYGTATNLKTASKTGYTFGGWFANPSCTGSAVTSLGATAYTSNITLYAKWTINSYDITFSQPEHGSIAVNASTTSPVSVNHGTNATVAVTPASGYKIKTLTDNGNAIAEAVGYTSSYGYTITGVTGAHTIIAEMESAGVCGFDLDKTEATLDIGGTTTFTATPNAYHVGGTISAVSSDTSIATVSKNNNTYTVTAVKHGTATITVSCTEGGSATFTVTVNTPTISISADDTELNIGETTTVRPTVTHQGTATVSYHSNHPAIVSVDGSGELKALKPGTANITATVDGVSSTYITVTVNTPSLTFSYTPSTIYVDGDTAEPGTVTANNANADSTISTLTYAVTSGGTSGSVAANGTVTSGSAAGTVTVRVTGTVSYNGVSYTGAIGTSNIIVRERESVYLLGLTNEGSWSKTDDLNKMTYDSTDGLFKLTLKLYQASTTYQGDNGFKISVDDTQYGGNYTINGMQYNQTTLSSSGGNLKLTTIDFSGVTSSTVPYKFTYSVVTKELTVYYPMTVAFNANGHGTAPSTVVAAYGSTIDTPTAPTADGYTFAGWYKEAACENAFNFATDTVTQDTTLYAKWDLNSYRLTKGQETHGTFTLSPEAGDVPYQTPVTVTCSPELGYKVSSVKYGEENAAQVSGSSSQWTFNMPNADTTVNVTFVKENYNITKEVSPSGAGSVSVKKSGSETGTYQIGDSLVLAATPDATHRFTNFIIQYSDNTTATITNNNKTVSMAGKTGAITVTANFELKTDLPVPVIKADNATPTQSNPLEKDISETVTITITNYDTLKTYCDLTVYYDSTVLSGVTFNSSGEATITFPDNAAGYKGENKNYYVKAAVKSAYSADYMINNAASANSNDVYIKVYKPLFELAGNVDLILNSGKNSAQWGSGQTGTSTGITIGTPVANRHGVYSYTFKVTGTSGNAYFEFCAKSGTKTRKALRAHDGTYYNTNGSNLDVSNGLEESDCAYIQTVDGSNPGGGFMVARGKTYVIYIDQTNNDDTNTDKVGSFWIENLSCYIGSIAKAQTFNLATDQYNAVTDATSSQGTVTAPTEAVTKGQSATVTATPAEGYHFAGWYSNENCTGTRLSENSSYTFTVTEDVTYYALFQQTVARRTVTVVSVDHVTVTASYCSHSADEGESMEIPVGANVNYTIALDRGCQLDAVSPSDLISLEEGTNSFTMPAVDVTITITASKTLYALRGVVSPNKGSILFYDSERQSIDTATYNQLVYVECTPDEGYLLKKFTYEGNGITEFTRIGDTNVASFRMGDAAATVTAHVVMQSDITYYVDLHNNSVESLEFAIVTSATGNEVQTDYKGELCEKTLSSPLKAPIQQLQNSSVYSATISTPVTKSGPTYSNLFIRIKLNGKSYVTTLNGNQVAAMLQTQTVWLEAVNETSQELKLSFATNTTSAVESGKRRIYLAKPYSWNATSESGWENIGIYYWGDNPIDIGWNNGIKMHYLGYDGTGDDGTKYYYADIPKAILDAQNNKSYTVHSIIFQGWGSNTAAGSYGKKQTSNIESIGDANFFVLSKDGSSYVGTPGENVVIPGYTRYTGSVKMNIRESKTINITPTYTGGDVVFESEDTEKLEVNNGVIVPHASTVVGGTNTPVAITVTVRGTIGAKNLTGGESGAADAITYQVPVELYDPTKFQGFNAMSFQTATYTVQIKAVESTDNPGYFNMNAVSITVSGIKGNDSLRKSAIITPGSPIVVDSETKYTSFTVMYAKTNTFQNVDPGDYTNIKLVGDVETLSITQTNTGKRYGHKEWHLSKVGEQTYTNPGYKTTTSISNKVETAKTSGIIFTGEYDIYTAFFEEYQYVDVTFTFNYDVYKPEVVTINKATGLPLTPEEEQDQTVVTETRINYPYDAEYAEQEGSHETITVQVKGYEVRGKISPANNNSSGTKIARDNLKIDAIKALGSYTKNNTETLLLNNNYYNYEVDDTDKNSIIIDSYTCDDYTADVTVNLTKSPKTYNVYLWNGTTWESKATNLTYQAYADVSVPGSEKVKWYAVSEDNRDTDNAPLLANDTGYRFRVKGDTYLVTEPGTISDDEFNRSEVDFSHYEIAHKEKVIGQTTQMTEYLRQNFYIADFFAPSKVFDPNTEYDDNGETKYLPYDEVKFVGGGVVYYSVTDGVPFSNAVSAGYVEGETGTVNADAIKEMLKSKIEAQYAEDNLAGVIGEEDAMKAAYGTEIPVTKNVEGGFNTGIFYRYLPMETYTRDSNGKLVQENDVYTLDKTTNVNTFRYSNTLQSYQYVYASGNENKATNDGKNMRLYSYYVYSYLTYNQDTNLPESKYEVVLSDNYADASTYWAGN